MEGLEGVQTVGKGWDLPWTAQQPINTGRQAIIHAHIYTILESPINLHVFGMREEAGASGKNMHHPAIHLHHDSHHFHSYQSIERASFDFQRVPASAGLQS